MREGRWSDWQVRTLAENFAAKRPKREWFNHEDHYEISHKSWAHLSAKTLFELQLEERQLIIWLYHFGLEHVGVQTFDPTEKGLDPKDVSRQSQSSDFVPSEGR